MAAIGGILLLVACVRTQHVPNSGYDFTPVAERLARDCASGAFSGAVAISLRGHRSFEYVCGEADIDRAAPIRWESRYRIFSTSKLPTALTVMRMVERGTLDLDSPIRRYIPESPESWAGVTIRHLLNHTSGIPDRTNDLLDTWRGSDSQALDRILHERAPRELAPATAPGAEWRYNNFGYELLAEAVERTAGQPFAEVLAREVFAPAGMRTALLEQGEYRAGVGLASVDDPLLVTGYNGSAAVPERAGPFSFLQRGAGAIHASVEDLLALGGALLDYRVVSPETWALMTATFGADSVLRAGPARAGYGLGVVVRGDPLHALGHSGGVNGYLTMFDVIPERQAVVVVVTNRAFADARGLSREIEQILHAR